MLEDCSNPPLTADKNENTYGCNWYPSVWTRYSRCEHNRCCTWIVDFTNSSDKTKKHKDVNNIFFNKMNLIVWVFGSKATCHFQSRLCTCKHHLMKCNPLFPSSHFVFVVCVATSYFRLAPRRSQGESDWSVASTPFSSRQHTLHLLLVSLKEISDYTLALSLSANGKYHFFQRLNRYSSAQ